METNNTPPKKAAAALSLIAILGWLAIGVQFYLYYYSCGVAFAEMLIRFFSFFTILTNILVAACCTALLLFPNSRPGKRFAAPQTQTAIAVYILIVGLIYNVILRFLWQPQGMQRFVDELLHLLVPILFLGYWFFFVAKQSLRWNDCWAWLVYPLIYLAVILVRGAMSGYYPYPFVDVGALGYRAALLNSLGIALLFVFFSLLFIGVGKLLSKNRKLV